jgi:hypothetical protein
MSMEGFHQGEGRGCSQRDLNFPGVPMVRALFPASTRRLAQALLLHSTLDSVLVDAGPAGPTRACERCSDRRRHQELRYGTVHASHKRQLTRGYPNLKSWSLWRQRASPARQPSSSCKAGKSR